MKDVIAEEIGTLLRGYVSEVRRALEELPEMTDDTRKNLERRKALAEDLLEIFY